MLDVDASGSAVLVVPELGGLERSVEETKSKASLAARLQVEAAEEVRTEVAELRGLGLSVTDIAAVMKVSRGRASQLVAASSGTSASRKNSGR